MAGLYDDRIVGLKEQKEFARRLREQQQEPAGQMVSGWYVPNTGGAVVNALRNVLGAYQERQADEELKGVERERAKDIANVYAQMGVQAPESLLKQAGTEEIKPGMIDRFTALLRGEEAKGTPAQLYQQPALAQNVPSEQRDAALMSLYNIDPSMAAPLVAHEQFKLSQQQAAELKREALAQQAELKRESMAQNERQDLRDIEMKKTLANLSAQNRQPQSQFEYKEINGQPYSFNRFTNQLAQIQGVEGDGFSPKKLTPEQQRIQDANDAIGILKQAAPLINKSTSSGIGAGADYAMSLFGKSTEGADVASQLKVLGGALVSKMPKMSGPQSDKDVLLYKEMAGKIGDPTIPTSQKIAAMNSINELNARYAGVEPAKLNFEQPSGQGGFSIRPLGQ